MTESSEPRSGRRKAVFLDRDGVLNEVISRDGKMVSPRRPEEFRISPDTKKAVCAIRDEFGALAIVVTNQPDLERGHLHPDDLDRMHRHLKRKIPIDDLFVCPHGSEGHCGCRKPQPGMLLEAASRWNIDLHQSFMIGDNQKDVEAGRQAGCKTILLKRSYNNRVTADYEADTLLEAVETIRTKWRTSP